jgi:hypothetical protein
MVVVLTSLKNNPRKLEIKAIIAKTVLKRILIFPTRLQNRKFFIGGEVLRKVQPFKATRK